MTNEQAYREGVHDAVIACARLLQSKRDCITTFQIEVLKIEDSLVYEKQQQKEPETPKD